MTVIYCPFIFINDHTTPIDKNVSTKVLYIAWGTETEFNIDSYIVHLSIFKTTTTIYEN